MASRTVTPRITRLDKSIIVAMHLVGRTNQHIATFCGLPGELVAGIIGEWRVQPW